MGSKRAGQRNWLGAVAVLLAALGSISCGGGAAGTSQTATTTGASLTLNTSSIDFGNVSVGSSKNGTITLTNSSASGGPSVTFSQVTAAGASFTASTSALPIVLDARGLLDNYHHLRTEIGGRGDGQFVDCGGGCGRSFHRVAIRHRARGRAVSGGARGPQFRQCCGGQQRQSERNADRGNLEYYGFKRGLERAGLLGERDHFPGDHCGRNRRSLHRYFHSAGGGHDTGQHFFRQQRVELSGQRNVLGQWDADFGDPAHRGPCLDGQQLGGLGL